MLRTRNEAAAALGMSLSSFARRVQPDVRMVVGGQIKLVSPKELERWIGEHSREPIPWPRRSVERGQ
jgi:hypothetical protein